MAGANATVISREQARAAGLKRYFTGKPCSQGHISERYTRGGGCAECTAARKAAWAREHPDRAVAWNLCHPEKMKEVNNSFYANNKKKRIGVARRCVENNKEHYAAYRKSYYKNHKQTVLANVRNRRARKRAAKGAHTAEDIAAIFKAQRGRCAYCRVKLGKKRHIDHVIPLVKGGSNDRANLQITCASCNLRKNAKHPNEFAREVGLLI